jgi:hypothetical protein
MILLSMIYIDWGGSRISGTGGATSEKGHTRRGLASTNVPSRGSGALKSQLLIGVFLDVFPTSKKSRFFLGKIWVLCNERVPYLTILLRKCPFSGRKCPFCRRVQFNVCPPVARNTYKCPSSSVWQESSLVVSKDSRQILYNMCLESLDKGEL